MLGFRRRGVAVKSSIKRRAVVIGGHKTGIILEDAFWTSLKEIAQEVARACIT
jgi:predicted DNA-binding ribbon-helix-helix protein